MALKSASSWRCFWWVTTLMGALIVPQVHGQISSRDPRSVELDASVRWTYTDPYKARGFTASSIDMYFEGVSPDAEIDERIVQPAGNLSDVPLRDQYFFCELLRDRLSKRYGTRDGPHYQLRYRLRTEEARRLASEDPEATAAAAGELNTYAIWRSGMLEFECPSEAQRTTGDTPTLPDRVTSSSGSRSATSVRAADEAEPAESAEQYAERVRREAKSPPKEKSLWDTFLDILGVGVAILLAILIVAGLLGSSNSGGDSDSDDSFGGFDAEPQYRVQYTGPGIAGWINASSDFSTVSTAIEVCDRRKASDPRHSYRVVEISSNGRTGSTVYSA